MPKYFPASHSQPPYKLYNTISASSGATYSDTAERRPCAQGAALRPTAPVGRKEKLSALPTPAYKPSALRAGATTRHEIRPALRASKPEGRPKKRILTGQGLSKRLPNAPNTLLTRPPTLHPRAPTLHNKSLSPRPKVPTKPPTPHPKRTQTTNSKK